MSFLKNVAAFKNWPLLYAHRYGWVRREFEMIHRSGVKMRLRPDTDDLTIVKSNFVTKHYFRDFVPIRKESIVVDVGAHIGSFSIMASRRAQRVLAFEPEPSNFQMLKRNVELNLCKNISIFEMAVSGRGGYQEIHIDGKGSTGSHSLYQGIRTAEKKRRVQTVSLDEMIKKEGLSRIDFLKLDCEGAEHEILREIRFETAARIRGMAMETHRVSDTSLIDIPGRLRELGFEVKIEHRGGYVYAWRAA